jgi:hypothetical protein
MPKIKKTKENPYGLPAKQRLMIEDMIQTIRDGGDLDPVKSTKKIYNPSNDNSARVMSSNMMNDSNFRAALISGLHDKKILGRDSKVERVLEQGLDAEGKEGEIDYRTRLEYVKEINKVAGVYAPQKVERKSMSLNLDVSEEELDKKIAALQEELE